MDFRMLRFSHYQAVVERLCEKCQQPFSITDFEDQSWGGGANSLRYREFCDRVCYSCWLGVGPMDSPESHPVFQPDAAAAKRAARARENIHSLEIGSGWEDWPRNEAGEIYQAQCSGDLLKAYAYFTDLGIPLVLMPLSQVFCDRSVHYPYGITYYPPGTAKLDGFNVVENDPDSESPSIRSSAAAGASMESFQEHGLLVFPATFDASLIETAGHEVQVELIRRLSEEIDKICLNFVRYYSCSLDRCHAIPARAGQLASDPAMSICLVFDPERRQSKMYGGAAFSVAFTGGIGIWLKQPEWQHFPAYGEVGNVVYQALALYAAMLEAGSDTHRYIQALSLLEFLAFPNDYKSFPKVKKVISRYVARDQNEYDQLLERFRELTGKKDEETGIEKGYRTRVVHIGDRIESMIPDPESRKDLFAELDGYIRPVIDHMISHSEMNFDEYVEIRKTFPDFLAEQQAG